MKLTDVLEAGHIVLGIPADDIDGCVRAMTRQLVGEKVLTPEQEQQLDDALMKREALGGTTIGRGVAIPHAYLAGFPRPMVLVGRLAHDMVCETPDGRPVDLIFLLTGPEEAEQEHLRTLAHIVRLLHDQALLEALRSAGTPEEVLRAVDEAERRHG